MPLVKLQNRGFNGVNQYLQNREVGGAQPEPGQRSLTPQPQRERSKQRANETIEHKPRASSRDAVGGRQGNMARQEFAKGLKMAVPDTMAKAKADQAQPTHHHGSDVASITAQHKTSRTDPRAELHHEPIASGFDDTQSLHFDESTSIADGQETQMNLGFGFDPQDGPPPYQRPIAFKQFSKPSKNTQQSLNNVVGPGWHTTVDHERVRRGEAPKYGTRFDEHTKDSVLTNEALDDGYEPDGEFAGDEPNTWDTPSRTRMGPEGHHASQEFIKHESQQIAPDDQASPPLPHQNRPLGEIPVNINGEIPQQQQQQQHKSRFRVLQKQFTINNSADLPDPNEPAVLAQHPRQQNIQPPPFSSKVSSYHESSSEEDHAQSTAAPTSPGRRSKRPREEALDYDSETLAGKTMKDIDDLPFTTDPSAGLRHAEPALDMNGTPISLATKLTNLTKMREEDQKLLFRSLTDADREQTASWFLEKFQADVRKLMDVRLERRKIALKYELEVKKRYERVETKKKDVDEELAGLRKGGGELIAGKSMAKGGSAG
ncbi:hypothetical protein LTR99_000189 [Exophiala xenobiotica]|uniref:Extracellular mutant protein 11 C-terminal domain-containing protein n=1 Tax=Vermiconidia calcicola TaxID=1690605 RepID=A0AAV9PVG5_9PEZI|nr:hypothetical protein LTR99_000189 [Exophiala xenobiotica]KAK5439223.1 hypothetical protein LTR34_000189 [Exophiala xenobiotica]KAK5530003.1 hypothetical protein LTR25_009247 [Vermiconidia calcicola]KAK5547322.1 hypothetical protein LTR23_002542 [Chaetothyriales sp. CCFEE 6169]